MSPEEAREWKRQLGHVRWIGGPPDAGKSTVTQLLESTYGVPIYRMDGHEMEHLQRADAMNYPLHVALREQIDRDEQAFLEGWVTIPPLEQAVRARAIWIERLPMICADLLGLPHDGPCIAEGPGFFPAGIRPLLCDPHQAAWLIPTESFKRASHARRNKSDRRHRTSDPERYLRNHIERDLQMAMCYREELREGDCAIEVDGTVPPEAVAERVAIWFGLAV